MKKAQIITCLGILFLLTSSLQAELISGDFTLSATAAALHPYWDSKDQYPPVSDYDEVRFTFQPAGEQIEIHLGLCGVYESPRSAFWGINLSDTNTGELVWNQSYSEGIYSINRDHIYEFYLYAGTTVTQGDIYNGAQAEVYFFITPEPATLSLLALGAMGLRRRRI